MNKKIGAQLYTVRDFCRSREDFKESVLRVKEIGYSHVQMSGVGPFGDEDVLDCGDFIRKTCDANGIVVSCTHRPLDSLTNHFEEEIAFHRAMGCNIMGVGSIPKEARENKECLMEVIEKLNAINDKAVAEGFTFTYHNHAFEFEKIDGRFIMDYILEYGRFSLLVDVYWLAYAGINPAKFIREHADRVACVHFKDLAIINRNEIVYAPVGEGNLDWDDIIAACEDADVKFAMVEQDQCRRDPFDCLKSSCDFLLKKGFN